MTQLYNKIQSDAKKARLERDKFASFFVTLLGDIQRIAKDANREVTDDDCLKVIKKWVATQKSITENKNIAVEYRDNAQEEINLLEMYLPDDMDIESLRTIISEFVFTERAKSIKDMGKIMKLLKEHYPNRYDAQEASKIIKACLNDQNQSLP